MPKAKRKPETFSYADLNEKARRRAYEDWYEHEPYNEWWDCVFEQVKEKGLELGFEIADIYFSGFWSQGDGASWTGTINVKVYVEKHPEEFSTDARDEIFKELLEQEAVENYIRVGTNNCRAHHEMTMSLTNYDLVTRADDFVLPGGMLKGATLGSLMPSMSEYLHLVSQELLNAARNYACEIYKALEAEHEYLTSEEQFKEQCEANDWRFDEDGRMV